MAAAFPFLSGAAVVSLPASGKTREHIGDLSMRPFSASLRNWTGRSGCKRNDGAVTPYIPSWVS